MTDATPRKRHNGASRHLNLANVNQRLEDHVEDEAKHRGELTATLNDIGKDVKAMATTLATIVAERQAETLFQKWKKDWLVWALGLGGVALPLAGFIHDHLVK